MSSSSFRGSNFSGRPNQQSVGGFFHSQATNDDQLDGSQPKATRSATDHRSMIPATIKQLKTASQKEGDDVYVIDGHEFSQVTLVGISSNISSQSTFSSFHLEDGTGTIFCRMFYDEGASFDAMENSYIRVFGRMRSHGGERSLIVLKILPVTDFNEITFHLTEVVHIHCQNTLVKAKVQSSAHGTGTQPSFASSNSGRPNMSNLDERVLGIIRDYKDPSGPSIQDIVVACNSNRATIVGSLERLSSEAFIYTTIDDEHYQIIQ